MKRRKQSKRRAAAKVRVACAIPIAAMPAEASSVFRDVDAMVRAGESAGMTTQAAFTTAMLAYADGLRPPEFERMFRRGEGRIQ